MKVIITGAASGIGRACAMELASTANQRQDRTHLMLVDFAHVQLQNTVDGLSNFDIEVVSHVADLSRADFAHPIVSKAFAAFGGVDTLISNAGTFMTAPMESMDLEDFERMFAVNTRATWLLSKACHHLLKLQSSSIVATASISASQPTPPHGAYGASKAALVMLIRQMAYEWGPHGIRCNCVSPGMIHTGMTDQVYSDPVKRADRAALIPLRRVGDAQDVARAVAFLTSPQAAYITGVDLAVDGGVQTSLMPTLRGASYPR
jgi:NAD(P)-dependent dehydrogenase (short-subunit alcohol dehydrogenase family)